MNIFYIDSNPIIAAHMLADSHIRKMQIESAQMCSTAHHMNPSDPSILPLIYKKTHFNHPSTIWVRQSIQHYNWVIEHGLEICNEFEERYEKVHATSKILTLLKSVIPNIPDIGFTPPPLCMPDQYKTADHVEAYRNFYIEDKVKIKHLKWSKLDNKPDWVNIY